jgi:hypothetical protein
MARLALLNILLLLSGLCLGQNPPKQTIVFKDGSRVSGVVVSDSAEIVKFKVDNPMIITFNKNQLMTIDSSPFSLAPITKSSGYFMHFTSSVLAGKNDIGNSYNVSINLTNGYQLANGLRFGIGTGLENLKIPVIPLYADFNYHPFNSKVSPYLYFKTGYGIALQNEDEIYQNGYPIKNSEGGFLFNIGAGVALYSWQNTAITFGVGYRYQRVIIRTSYGWWDNNWVNEYITDFNRIEMQLGFVFK